MDISFRNQMFSTAAIAVAGFAVLGSGTAEAARGKPSLTTATKAAINVNAPVSNRDAIAFLRKHQRLAYKAQTGPCAYDVSDPIGCTIKNIIWDLKAQAQAGAKKKTHKTDQASKRHAAPSKLMTRHQGKQTLRHATPAPSNNEIKRVKAHKPDASARTLTAGGRQALERMTATVRPAPQPAPRVAPAIETTRTIAAPVAAPVDEKIAASAPPVAAPQLAEPRITMVKPRSNLQAPETKIIETSATVSASARFQQVWQDVGNIGSAARITTGAVIDKTVAKSQEALESLKNDLSAGMAKFVALNFGGNSQPATDALAAPVEPKQSKLDPAVVASERQKIAAKFAEAKSKDNIQPSNEKVIFGAGAAAKSAANGADCTSLSSGDMHNAQALYGLQDPTSEKDARTQPAKFEWTAENIRSAEKLLAQLAQKNIKACEGKSDARTINWDLQTYVDKIDGALNRAWSPVCSVKEAFNKARAGMKALVRDGYERTAGREPVWKQQQMTLNNNN